MSKKGPVPKQEKPTKKVKDKKLATTPSFVHTLKLRYCKAQEQRLDKLFRLTNNLYNDLVCDRKKALQQLQSSPEYIALMGQIKAVLADTSLSKKEHDAALKPLNKQKSDMMKDAGITKFGFHHAIIRLRNQFGHIINSQVGNCTANAVWSKFEKCMYGNGKTMHFRPWRDCRSIESSSPTQGIVFKGDRVMIGRGFEVKVKLTGSDYERECLEHCVKYCRIVRIPWKQGWLYKLQLILEGVPPVIRGKDGQPKHSMGKGEVGLDIGLQDIAVVGDEGAMVPELAPNVNNPADEVASIQRKLDRMRRLSNPDSYDEKGRIIPINKLPKDRLTQSGKRNWIKSNNYRRLEQRSRYLQAKAARTRKYNHQALANQILEYGDVFNVEKMRWTALAKKAKLQQREDGTYKKRKRFGKSIQVKAPGTLIQIIKDKAKHYGGQVNEIDTWSTKASQYNHLTGEYKKIPLGQRWKTFKYNAGQYVLQRDLYSAFLLSCMNETLDGFEQDKCEVKFDPFIIHHQRAVMERETVDPRYKRSYKKYIEHHFPQGQMKLI